MRPKPTILDLFCGEGGASMGYALAGFDVVGVDFKMHRRYPFPFYEWDAMTFPLEGFDAIHASPPCQRFSALNKGRGNAASHPDLVGPIRQRLEGVYGDVPWVIENVPQAPLRNPITLCGSMFGLRIPAGYLRRHRGFESNVELRAPGPCVHAGTVLGVYGHGRGGHARADGTPRGYAQSVNAEDARALMGMPWASRDGCSQAIPPAYTEWIGRQLLAALGYGDSGWCADDAA